MEFIDLKAEYRFFKPEIDEAVHRVLSSGQYLFGAELKKLEMNMVKMTRSCAPSEDNWAVCVKNATDAIQMVLQRLTLGCKKSTLVVLPNFGAYPTSVAAHNVMPKENIFYVDVDRSMTIDPTKLPDLAFSKWRKVIILAVNLFGNDSNILCLGDYILNSTIPCPLVMDCAQSTGSATTAWGAYSIYSFYPTKPLASAGDGGCIVGRGAENEKWFRHGRFYGQDGRKTVVQTGGVNSRMDEIQAAIVNAKFSDFRNLTHRRRIIAERYLRIVKGIGWRSGAVYHLFPVLFNNRDTVIHELQQRQIPFAIHYEQHVSEMPALEGLNGQVGYRVNDKILSIPCHAFMKEDEIQKVEEFLYDVKGHEFVE